MLIKEGGANIHQERKLGLVSPLVLAATLGYLDILVVLLEHGANVNTTITGGMTALHLSASQGHTQIVRELYNLDND